MARVRVRSRYRVDLEIGLLGGRANTYGSFPLLSEIEFLATSIRGASKTSIDITFIIVYAIPYMVHNH